MAGLAFWQKQDEWTRGFIPMPMTWLKQRRWESAETDSDGFYGNELQIEPDRVTPKVEGSVGVLESQVDLILFRWATSRKAGCPLQLVITSPIQILFYEALEKLKWYSLTTILSRDPEYRWSFAWMPWGKPLEEVDTSKLCYIPQSHDWPPLQALNHIPRTIVLPEFWIGRYRTDFLIVNGSTSGWRCVAVECDGHDFHERMKEQAERDRSRDRELMIMGVHTMRFTGSEIYRDAKGCAMEVCKYLNIGVF